MSQLPVLETSALTLKDLSEQPAQTYILIVGSWGIGAHAIYVDDWAIKDSQILFYHNDDIILAFPADTGGWSVIRADLVHIMTAKEEYSYVATGAADKRALFATLPMVGENKEPEFEPNRGTYR